MSSRLTYAITCILAGASGSAAASAAQGPDSGANAGPNSGADTLQEVVVTAQRRTENIQDVPISIQAFTAQTLQQLNIATLEDYIRFLPNVTTANNGPGQNEVFMRGLSAGSQASQASALTLSARQAHEDDLDDAAPRSASGNVPKPTLSGVPAPLTLPES